MCEGMTDTFLRAAHSGGAAASLASSGRAPGGSRLRPPPDRGKLVAAARPARCRPGGAAHGWRSVSPPLRFPGRELASGASPDPLLRRTCPAGARGGRRLREPGSPGLCLVPSAAGSGGPVEPQPRCPPRGPCSEAEVHRARGSVSFPGRTGEEVA